MSAPGQNPNGGGYGRAWPDDLSRPYNAAHFMVRQILRHVRTATLAEITAVTNSGDPVVQGTVDVQPMVSMVDGVGNTQAHAPIFGLPYMRLQGGKWGVIADPAVGDIGMVAFCDRDISSVKATLSPAAPGSWREHDFADGIYLGTMLSKEPPEQWVRFHAGGIELKDLNNNMIQTVAAGIIINGVTFSRTQQITAPSGEITLGGHTLTAHHHGGVATGSGNTSTPTG